MSAATTVASLRSRSSAFLFTTIISRFARSRRKTTTYETTSHARKMLAIADLKTLRRRGQRSSASSSALFYRPLPRRKYSLPDPVIAASTSLSASWSFPSSLPRNFNPPRTKSAAASNRLFTAPTSTHESSDLLLSSSIRTITTWSRIDPANPQRLTPHAQPCRNDDHSHAKSFYNHPLRRKSLAVLQLNLRPPIFEEIRLERILWNSLDPLAGRSPASKLPEDRR